MKHPHYWQLKAAVLTAQVAKMQADAALRATIVAVGLNPDITYVMNDADESIALTPTAAPPERPLE